MMERYVLSLTTYSMIHWALGRLAWKVGLVFLEAGGDLANLDTSRIAIVFFFLSGVELHFFF